MSEGGVLMESYHFRRGGIRISFILKYHTEAYIEFLIWVIDCESDYLSIWGIIWDHMFYKSFLYSQIVQIMYTLCIEWSVL